MEARPSTSALDSRVGLKQEPRASWDCLSHITEALAHSLAIVSPVMAIMTTPVRNADFGCDSRTRNSAGDPANNRTHRARHRAASDRAHAGAANAFACCRARRQAKCNAARQ